MSRTPRPRSHSGLHRAVSRHADGARRGQAVPRRARQAEQRARGPGPDGGRRGPAWTHPEQQRSTEVRSFMKRYPDAAVTLTHAAPRLAALEHEAADGIPEGAGREAAAARAAWELVARAPTTPASCATTSTSIRTRRSRPATPRRASICSSGRRKSVRPGKRPRPPPARPRKRRRPRPAKPRRRPRL